MKINRSVNRRMLSADEKQWITENALEKSIKEMSKELNVGGQTIRTYCNKNEIVYNSKKRNFKPKEKKVFNPDYFNVHEMEYWVA